VAATFDSPELRTKEHEFLGTIRDAFSWRGPEEAEGLHLGGASRLMENLTREGVEHLDELLEILERRYHLLELLAGAMREDGVYLRIGREMTTPQLQSCSLVAISYGVPNRVLGTVSVLGPRRMDYQRAIASVRATADSLSTYLEEIW
jgi:heat-inducible transcriptional repressor